MISQSEVSLYVDAMIIEAIAEDPELIKQAGVGDKVMALIYKVKDYFADKIDPNNKNESIINLLSPVAINIMFSAFGMPWIGFFISLATRAFNINVAGILSSLYEKVKSLISGDKKTTSAEVEAAAREAVMANYKPATPEDEAALVRRLESRQSVDFEQQLRDARVVKLAMIAYQEHGLEANAAGWLGGLSFAGLQSKIVTMLITLFGWIFKIGLGSAGAIVIGDAIYNFLNRSSSSSPTSESPVGGLFSSFMAGPPTPPTAAPTIYVAKQTKFPRNAGYQNTQYNKTEIWDESYPNPAGIGDMLIQFAKEVYSGLNGLEGVIRSTETFAEVVRTITAHNRTTSGSSVVYLPQYFHTKKQIVDLFIDDVAEKAP